MIFFKKKILPNMHEHYVHIFYQMKVDDMEKCIKQKLLYSILQTTEIIQEESICLPIPSPRYGAKTPNVIM